MREKTQDDEDVAIVCRIGSEIADAWIEAERRLRRLREIQDSTAKVQARSLLENHTGGNT